MTAVLALAAAFGLGALPWSLWAGRRRGIDIREHGSGNLGATNVYRVMGARWGIGVLVLDVIKGTAAVVAARLLAPDSGAIPALAAAAAVAGHMFTPFAAFRGGKGVATGLGVFLGLAPAAAGGAFLVWLAVVLFCGWVSLASGIAASVLPVFVLVTRDALGPRFAWCLGISVGLAVLILVRHRPNWRRIAAGTEQAIWEKRPETPDGGAARREPAPAPPSGPAQTASGPPEPKEPAPEPAPTAPGPPEPKDPAPEGRGPDSPETAGEGRP